jgi:tRNA pseudouridine38-40 synthase
VGEHDFSSFRAAGCQARSPRRRIECLDVTREGEFIHIDIKANAFLHHMVRNIAGSLMAIGSGERAESWLDEVLAGRDRRKAAMTAPAGGLYFLRADYPPIFQLPQQQRRPRLFY